MNASGPIVLYDEDCGVCRWAADKLVRFGRPPLRALPIQGREAQDVLEAAGVPVERRMESWHFAGTAGHLRSAGAAIGPLARTLPFGAPVGWVADHTPVTTERAYRWLARHRGSVGRLLGQRACSVDPSRSRLSH